MEANLQPEMIGRENELSELREFLDSATDGKGKTVLIAGEAGVGKTRLVSELGGIARSRGFDVLTGYGLYGSLAPYFTFKEALRSGDLDFLFAEEAPRVEAVYLMSQGGLLIESVVRKETELSPDLFASMLTGVVNYTKETLSALDKGEREGSLNALGHGDNRILIQSGESCNVATVLIGKENEFLIDDVREILRRVDRIFGNVLQDWDGEREKVEGINELLTPLVESGKYEGIYYGKDNPKARRDLLFESVSLGLVRKAQTAPTVLCLEDLQWADPSTLALMHYVARNTKDCGLLLMGTYRPEDVAVKEGNGHPLTSTLSRMSKENLHKMIQLQSLPQDTIDELLSSILGEFDFEEEFKIRIFKETEGNPLFVIQLVKLFVEEGIISRDNSTWKLAKDFRDVKIPSKIQSVVARRLDRVGRDDRKVLDYASVVGETFSPAILVDALGLEKDQLVENLSLLEKTHMLVHPDNGNYRFEHSRIKEVLYRDIPTELRMEYHSIIAGSIEAISEDNLDEVIGDLAFHYYECRNSEKALHYLILAAEEAKRLYSNEESTRFYGEILELEQDQQKRVEYLEALGEIYYHVGNYDMSINSYQSALELAGGRDRARIMAKIGGVLLEQGKFDESKKMCTEALELVKGEDCQEEALALRTIGTLYSKTKYLEQSREWYEQSLRINEKIGNQTGIAGCLNNIGVELLNTRYDEGLGYLERALEINRKIGDQRATAGCLNNIGIAKIVRGDYEGALECYERGLRISEKIGNQGGIARMVNNVGEIKLVKGEYDKALECYERGLKSSEKIGDQQGTALILNNIGGVHMLRGDYDKALEYHDRSFRIREDIGDSREMVHVYRGIAEVSLNMRNFKKALDFCNRAFELSKEIDNKESIALSRKIYGMIYREQKNWKKSTGNLEESIRILREIGTGKHLGDSYYEFGLMWDKKGDYQEARINLDKALGIFKELKLDEGVMRTRTALEGLGK